MTQIKPLKFIFTVINKVFTPMIFFPFLCTSISQAGDIVGAKARADESDGQKVALEDHVKTLKV